MNLDDIFRSFFGIHRPPQQPPDFDHGQEEGFPQQFHFGDTDAMQNHFDEMFRGFDEAFRSMGMSEFPGPRGRNEEFAATKPPPPPPRGGSLRDHMLKVPDSDSEDGQPQQRQPNFFHGFYSTPRMDIVVRPHQRRDRDLDNEVKKEDLDRILAESRLERDSNRQIVSHQQPSGTVRSRLSVRTYRNIDGQMEEQSTIQDSDGNQHKTVTRRLGDQSLTVTTRQNKDGTTEVEETTTNLDEKDKGAFENIWQSGRQKSLELHPEQHQGVLLPGQDFDPETRGIFKNLFGFNFPGFGRT